MTTHQRVQGCQGVCENPNTVVILSPTLAEAIASGQEDVEQEISQELVDQQELFVVAAMAKLGNPFHNERHVLEVAQRAYSMAMNAGQYTQNELRLLYLAALYHDFDHAGVTYRQLVKGGEFSNEEVAAIAFDEQLGRHLGISQRVTAQGLIVSTSFGQLGNAKLPKPELKRDYRPWTSMEWILHLADVSSVDCSFKSFLAHGQDLLAEMRQHQTMTPKCWCEFLAFEEGFLRYFMVELENSKAALAKFDYLRLKRRAQNALAKIANFRVKDAHSLVTFVAN